MGATARLRLAGGELFKTVVSEADEGEWEDEFENDFHGSLVSFSEGEGQGDAIEEAEFTDGNEGFFGVEGAALGVEESEDFREAGFVVSLDTGFGFFGGGESAAGGEFTLGEEGF